jgi:hypothetical protein
VVGKLGEAVHENMRERPENHHHGRLDDAELPVKRSVETN